MTASIRLTEYSHGAGCGCKIAPDVLDDILKTDQPVATDPRLLVGNHSRDDAAVHDLGNGQAVISTTDFFMPIVDDPTVFGRIAATNAISDVYAMVGTPTMAIAILGWPTDKLDASVAGQVVDGGRQACADAGITLAGGHSIDAPEPIFGLAVTGIVPVDRLKRNTSARPGCRLYLTKPLGIGILSTAQKQKKLDPAHAQIAPEAMCRLNTIGARAAEIDGVLAMTDVTGFGLLGHLSEICEGSGVRARIDAAAVPVLPHVDRYMEAGCFPGGTFKNYRSYGHKIGPLTDDQKHLLCDPQTSGGLLVAVTPEGEDAFRAVARAEGLDLAPVGELVEADADQPLIDVR